MAATLGNGKTWPANVVLCFFLLSVHLNEGQDTVNNGQEATSSQKLEVDKLLRKLNKPAVKSIKMRRTFRPEVKIESKMSSKSKPIVQPWHQVGSCPNRTIPIRRTRKEDILRASSIQQLGKKNLKTVPLRPYVAGQGGHEEKNIMEGKATMSVWQPAVQKDEYSISQIWVISDADSKNLNTIEAGWQ
ncbi:uncharacterized protein LOC114734417, partial [Neltuma alba]|uniref:uncharacterized protein LOC114734417 n=1 Tax=Neltuma alba TaxID=207710 RepID=UPI0010A59A7B